jgi:uncharacterized protein
MQKIVIDTNVFVSSLIQRGYSYLIINDLFIERKIDLCVSDELLKEYYDVLTRERFNKYSDFVSKSGTLLADIENKSVKYFPKQKFSIIKDRDDNKLLELASECKADFLITGNTNDFTLKKFKQTLILSPKEYWENHRPAS